MAVTAKPGAGENLFDGATGVHTLDRITADILNPAESSRECAERHTLVMESRTSCELKCIPQPTKKPSTPSETTRRRAAPRPSRTPRAHPQGSDSSEPPKRGLLGADPLFVDQPMNDRARLSPSPGLHRVPQIADSIARHVACRPILAAPGRSELGSFSQPEPGFSLERLYSRKRVKFSRTEPRPHTPLARESSPCT